MGPSLDYKRSYDRRVFSLPKQNNKLKRGSDIYEVYMRKVYVLSDKIKGEKKNLHLKFIQIEILMKFMSGVV